MSYSFFLRHKQGFFSSKILTMEDIFSLVPNLYNFSQMEKPKKEKNPEFFRLLLNKTPLLHLGHFLTSSRGFQLSYETIDLKNFYRVRVLTPSSIQDWKDALSFLKALSIKLKVPIESEYGERFTAETIESFDFKKDILFGIKSFFAESGDSSGNKGATKIDRFLMYGAFRPFVVTKELKEKILSSPNPIETFDNMLFHSQNPEILSAHQRFLKSNADGSIFGLYRLTQGIETFLPYAPFVEVEHSQTIKPEQVSAWKISLVGFEGDGEVEEVEDFENLGTFDYQTFLAHLPKDKYTFVDGAYMSVDALSHKDIRDLAEKCSLSH